MSEIDNDALATRRRHAAVVCRMLLNIVGLVQGEYSRKHIGAVVEEVLVILVVRVNDADGGKPLSVSAIARKLGIPRSNVSRAVTALLGGKRVVVKSGRGYVGNVDYLAGRIDAPYWRAIVKAITEAADQLRAG